jgi:anti-sigma regulatory factor (Ser/Thr protein kinase)
MRPPEPQLVRLPESHARGAAAHDLASFESFAPRAPFPRWQGRFRDSARVMEVELESGPDAAAEARATIGVLDGEADPDVLDDLRLLVSEMVTNSVRHASAPPGAPIGLAVSHADGVVRVEVTDAGRGFEPSPRNAPQLEAGGWGLHLVDRLATRWGVVRGRPARVWFELEPAA